MEKIDYLMGWYILEGICNAWQYLSVSLTFDPDNVHQL